MTTCDPACDAARIGYGGSMILVIDNYDSFTWNLVHYVMELGAEVRVVRNDALSAAEALATDAQAILISPPVCSHSSGPVVS